MRYAYIRNGTVVAISSDIHMPPPKNPAYTIVEAPDGLVEHQTYANGKFGLAPTTPSPTIADLTKYAANVRRQKDSSGLTVSGVGKIAIDPDSVAKIHSAMLAAQANPAGQRQWKLMNGSFVSLSATLIANIAHAVAGHVATCDAVEANVMAGIEASKINTTAQIDAAFAAIVN